MPDGADAGAQPEAVPPRFERELTASAAEWERMVGLVCPDARLVSVQGRAWIPVGAGGLSLRWRDLPPVALGAVRLPRLRVRFRFRAVPADRRTSFMQDFDRGTRRGGG